MSSTDIWPEKLQLAFGVVLLCLCASPAGCDTGARPSPMETRRTAEASATVSAGPQDGFKLFVLRQDWEQLLFQKYDLEDSWSVLSSVDLSDSLVTITPAAISTYDWSDQAILLTGPASQAFAGAFPTGELGLPVNVGNKCFVVTLNGERVYGGIMLEPWSSMGIDYPVMYAGYAGDVGGQVALLIRPKQFAAWAYKYESFPASLRSRIENQAVHDYFASLGKLTE